MQEIADIYADDGEVEVISIQTSFEGYNINSAEALEKVARDYSLSIPIGHSGYHDNPSPLLQTYQTRGTPWIVIIDKSGFIRFSNFHLPAQKSKQIIELLKNEK